MSTTDDETPDGYEVCESCGKLFPREEMQESKYIIPSEYEAWESYENAVEYSFWVCQDCADKAMEEPQ